MALTALKVWPETKRKIDIDAATYGIQRVELFDLMVDQFLSKDGRLAVVQNIMKLQDGEKDSEHAESED